MCSAKDDLVNVDNFLINTATKVIQICIICKFFLFFDGSQFYRFFPNLRAFFRTTFEFDFVLFGR